MVGSGDDPDKQMNTYVSTMYVRVRNFGVVTSQNWTRIGGDKLEPAWINKHITTAAEVKEDFSFFAGLWATSIDAEDWQSSAKRFVSLW